jgi:hypothetical protein
MLPGRNDAQGRARVVFTHYERVMNALRTEFPTLAIGHMTIPLRCPPTGWLAGLHEMLRRVHVEHACNRARAWFNAQLRNTHGPAGLLLDLAEVEFRRTDGRHHGRQDGAEWVPALAPEYTKDGGHLNVRGRRIAVRAFLEFLHTTLG